MRNRSLVLALVVVCLPFASHASAQTFPTDGESPGAYSAIQALLTQGPLQVPAAGGTPPSYRQTSPPPSPPSPPTRVLDPTAILDPSHAPLPLATAQCWDGWFSYSQTRRGTCAGHGGVLLRIIEPGTACAIAASRAEEMGGAVFAFQPCVATAAALPSSTTPPSACVSLSGGSCLTLCSDGEWSSGIGTESCAGHGGEAGLASLNQAASWSEEIATGAVLLNIDGVDP
jgi:hypothetical protein